MSGIVFLVAIIAIIGLPILLGVIGYKWLMRKGYSKVAFSFPSLIIGIPLYFILSALYPNDDFYIKEFESHTSIVFPKSGVFLKKDATYPDQHGSYTSMAIIKLSEEDYQSIYQKLNSSSQFKADTSSYHFLLDTIDFLESGEIAINEIKLILVGYKKAQFKIGFVNDRKTIIFERHSS